MRKHQIKQVRRVGAYTRRFMMRRFWHTLVNTLYPEDLEICTLCHRPLLGDGNTQAHDHLPGLCLFCLQEARKISNAPSVRYLRLGKGIGMTYASSLRVPVYCGMPYDGLARTAIRAWKYDGATLLTPWFAEKMVKAMEEMTPPNVIIPVPTTRDRYVKRGYHHVYLLAQSISDMTTGVQVEHGLVRRAEGKAFTQSQTAKTARERLQTLMGKFAVSTNASLTGKRVLLVDDVVTTGATLLTCTRALIDAGVQEVVCAAIAQVD